MQIYTISKKENIGLIEVMGLAVLPSRLKMEMEDLKTVLLSGIAPATLTGALAQHATWAGEVLAKHPEFNTDTAQSILEEEIGFVFAQVLADAGVYKLTPDGRVAFMKFVASV